MIRREVGDWSCQIKLRREVNDSDGSPIVPSEPEFSFGDLITDPKDVEKMLRRAQLAILNPSVEARKFVGL